RSFGPPFWRWEVRLSLSPIGRVLFTLQKHRVQALLMGGQACILYGAAEFSRDIDLAVLASAKNLQHLRDALAELRAEPVYLFLRERSGDVPQRRDDPEF